MVRDWFPAFSGPWVRLLRKLFSADSFLLCCACWPECWLHYYTGPRVTWEASLAGKKLLINYDDWKIGLLVMSPEQDNANRECTHIFNEIIPNNCSLLRRASTCWFLDLMNILAKERYYSSTQWGQNDVLQKNWTRTCMIFQTPPS